MTRTLTASTPDRERLPFAGRVFGLFTPLLNRRVARIAGGRYVPFWALLRHRGRSSGRAYATPVTARHVSGGFAVPLAFGEAADWYRNLRANGQGTIRWRGVEHAVCEVALVDAGSAIFAFPAWQRALFGALGIQRFVYLKEK